MSNRVSAGSENGASSKVQILEAPRLNPGDCVMCGASRTDDRQYIDIGLTVDFIGVIYFCTKCMQEVANTLGCLMPEQTKQLEDELDAARTRILEFETKDQALNDAIDALRTVVVFNPGNRFVVRDSDLQHQPLISDQITAEQSRRITQDRSESEQSDSEQRPDDLSSSSDYDFGQFL